MPIIARLFFALIGGVVGGAIVLAVVAALFYGLAPRRVPIGIFLLPFMGFGVGALIGFSADFALKRIRTGIDEAPSNMRLWFAFSALWMIVVVVGFSIFEPFGRHYDVTRWYGRDWLKFLTILLGPVVVGLLGLQIFSWATRSRNMKHSDRTAHSDGQPREPRRDIYQTISTAIEDGDITPTEGVQITKRYEELLRSTGDRKSARLQLADWIEQEASRRRAAARARD